jgi:hypothetical protein
MPGPGFVPPELVGTWHGADESYTFREDTTVSRDVDIASNICSTQAREHGRANAEGSTLTISWEEGEITVCGNTDPYQPYTEVLQFEIQNGGQKLVLAGSSVAGFDKQ